MEIEECCLFFFPPVFTIDSVHVILKKGQDVCRLCEIILHPDVEEEGWWFRAESAGHALVLQQRTASLDRGFVQFSPT